MFGGTGSLVTEQSDLAMLRLSLGTIMMLAGQDGGRTSLPRDLTVGSLIFVGRTMPVP